MKAFYFQNYSLINKINHNLIIFTIVLILASCGGGGGSSAPPITPAVNTAPQAGADITITIKEDTTKVPLNLSVPIDSDGDNLTLIVQEIPTSGTILKGDGQSVSVGYEIGLGSNIFGSNGLTFTPDANTNDTNTDYGVFTYSISDGVTTVIRNITFSVLPSVDTWPGANWNVVDPDKVNMDKARLKLALDYAFAPNRNTQSVVIVRHGVIVAEQYADGKDRTSLVTSWSSGKSVTSALIGIAIDKEFIKSVDDKVCEYITEWNCNLRNLMPLISIRDLLEMRSGLSLRNGLSIYGDADDQLAYSLDRSAGESGTIFNYSNEDSMILSGVIETATGLTAREYGERELFSKIGMITDWWSDKAGHTMTYCCIDSTSRDFARFGLLYARDGKWQDSLYERLDQVISKTWVDESTKLAEGLTDYGLHWWVFPSSGFIGALGLHSNDIWIHKSLDLVVVRNSEYTRYGTESIRTGANIQSTKAPDSWNNTEFLTLIADSIKE